MNRERSFFLGKLAAKARGKVKSRKKGVETLRAKELLPRITHRVSD